MKLAKGHAIVRLDDLTAMQIELQQLREAISKARNELTRIRVTHESGAVLLDVSADYVRSLPPGSLGEGGAAPVCLEVALAGQWFRVL